MTNERPTPDAADPAASFVITHASETSRPRVGRLTTGHGRADTPCFLPIATHGSLRAMTFDEAAACGTTIVMANAWHVYREATPESLRAAGGAHGMIGWPGILCTDSGGYQVFSLRDETEVELADEGVTFGSDEGALTPEHVVRMQKHLGSDIMMVLDDCAPFPCAKQRAADAVRRTSIWAERSIRAHAEIPPVYGHPQQLWGIVQGGAHEDLRRQSIEEVARFPFDGYGIGGLSIGIPRPRIRELTALSSDLLPADKPRHLLGVGLPPQVLEGIEDGADTFDCVLPIRRGQRGFAYTSVGEIAYKRPQPGALADAPLDPACACEACRTWSRERLRQLYRTDKPAAGRLAAIHNITFYHRLLADARAAIREDRFAEFKRAFLATYAAAAAASADE